MYPADDTPGDREAQASFQVESTCVSIEQAGSCLWVSTKLTTTFATTFEDKFHLAKKTTPSRYPPGASDCFASTGSAAATVRRTSGAILTKKPRAPPLITIQSRSKIEASA